MSNNLPDYEKAMKFSETNYTEDGIELDKVKTAYPNKVRNDYSIENIYITGGGYVDYPFTGGSPESPFGWQEFVWKKSPSRNAKFMLNNIDTIDVGLVARCEINIKYMNYEDYLVFRHIVTSERHFMVKFFDVDQKKWVSRDMYCTENSKSRLYTLKQSLIGVIDMSIKLVGTNNDLDDSLSVKKYTVKYDLNGGTGTKDDDVSVTRGSQIVLSSGDNIVAPTGKALIGWQTKSGETVTGSYKINQSITLWKDLTLYAWYE